MRKILRTGVDKKVALLRAQNTQTPEEKQQK